MDNATLAETLDSYAHQVPASKQSDVLSRAVTAWRNAGNVQHEAIDVRQLVVVHQQQEYQQRLFELYLSGNITALFELTTQTTPLADAAANYILAGGTPGQAYQALAHRAATRSPVWNSANAALLGLYYGDTTSRTDTAFQSTLGDLTIGKALITKSDTNQPLTGEPWFYYGGRYGFFLTLTAQPAHDPEDYLAAEIERAPSDPASFSALAQTYFSANKFDASIAEYRHAIELDPADPAPDISIADVLWSEQRHDEALAELTTALTKLRARVDLRAVPESFWTDFAGVASDADDYQLGTQLKPAMTVVLEAYIRKNGTYRSTELLQSAFTALAKPKPADAIAWMLSLVAAASTDDQLTMISELAEETWIPSTQLGALNRAEIALAQTQGQAKDSDASSDAGDDAPDQVTTYKTKYLKWLLTNNRAADAQVVLDSLTPAQRESDDIQPITILLAARQSRIPTLLAGYQSNPKLAPDLTVLGAAANILSLKQDFVNSRLLLEYVFQQKLEQQDLSAPDYLGLAEVRIATSDLPGALDVLNRLILQGDFYANLDSAASLLERANHFTEALPLLTKLANGTPWDAKYQLRLAKAQLALKQSGPSAGVLISVAFSNAAPYATRAEAASVLHGLSPATRLNSVELALLATTTPTQQQASEPYFVYARMAAANAAPSAQRAALLREAIAIAPPTILDWLRLQLFRTELSLHHDQQASVAIAPVLLSDSALFLPPSTSASGDNSETDDSPTSPTTLPTDTLYSITAAFPTPQSKLTFLLDLASMEEHLNNNQEAIEHLQAATELATNSAEAARLALRIQALQASLDLAQQNAARRPVLQPSVDQTNVVQPRLMSSAKSEVHP
jgi:tetratricopeptide (TPR) repeat protein